ncbi:LysR family transcriptional regulator [Lichenicoccus sp.]|uniref:LysR family transcriptional regulator n=1 Tax=Lichenicoccus sp. TaxID=2781899 RepID=UPI003D0A9BF3
MELRHLRHFVAVAAELHFARAAERLGMEQSPLSHSIRNLEAELKTKLFHRTTRRTWLTRAGARFYADARRILNDVDASAASLVVERNDDPDHVRLALAEDLAGEPFTRLLFELEHHRPAALVEVRELTHGEAAKLVRDCGADVALTLDGRASEDLIQVRGWAEPLMLVVPIGHPLAERDEVDLGEIRAERLALPRPTICPGYLAQIDGLLERSQARVAERVTVRHWNTAVSFASTGRALALVPASFVNGATSVAIVPVSQPGAELVTWILHREEPSPAVSLVLEVAALIDAEPVPLELRVED